MSFTQYDSRPLRILTTVRPGKGETPSLTHLETFSRVTALEATLYCAIYDPHLSSWRSGSSAAEVKRFLIEHEYASLEALKKEFGAMCKGCDTRVEWHHPESKGIIAAAKDVNADAVFLASSRLTQSLDYHDWEVLTQSSTPVLICNTLKPQQCRRVLVAVDPTHAHQKAKSMDTHLLTEANAIARLFDAEIHAVHAYPSSRTYVTPEVIVPQEIISSWQDDHASAVKALVEPFNVEKIHLVPAHPRDAILDTAEQINADLIVIGVSSRSRIADLVVGHTAEHIINHSKRDVLCLNAGTGLS